MSYGGFSSNRRDSVARLPREAKEFKKARFEYGELAHQWEHETQSHGWHVKGRMFFEPDTGDKGRTSTIYSYGHHFPLGTIYHVGKRVVVLLNSQDYSATTKGHKDFVLGATSHMERFYVSDPRKPENAREHFESIIEDNLADALNPRKKRISSHITAIESAIDNGNALSKAFKLGWRLKLPKAITPELRALSVAKDIKAGEAKRLRDEAYSAKFAEQRARAEEQTREVIRAWRTNADIRLPWGAENSDEWKGTDTQLVQQREGARIDTWRANGGAWGYHELMGTYLRLNGDMIQTSKGAEFPVEHGKRAWPIVKRCQRTGTQWQTNGHTIHLGHYSLTRIAADGTVTAGCHVVPFSEIERIAKELGL